MQFALSRIPRSKSSGLYASYTKFEKQHGTRTTLENTVLGKRRIQYEEELSHDGRNYDAWFDYARLEEGAYCDIKEEGAASDELDAAVGRVREVYERAVAQVPPGGEKRHWRRYIFLWLDYALFEEIETKVKSFIILTLQFRLLKQKTTQCSRIIPGHDKCTKQLFLWYPTSSSLLQNCGLCLRNLKFGALN